VIAIAASMAAARTDPKRSARRESETIGLVIMASTISGRTGNCLVRFFEFVLASHGNVFQNNMVSTKSLYGGISMVPAESIARGPNGAVDFAFGLILASFSFLNWCHVC